MLLPRFDTADGHGEVLRRGVPVRRVGGHLVTTVFDLVLAQYGVGRAGLPGDWPTGYDDAGPSRTPRPGRSAFTSVPADLVRCGSPGRWPTTPSAPAAAR